MKIKIYFRAYECQWRTLNEAMECYDDTLNITNGGYWNFSYTRHYDDEDFDDHILVEAAPFFFRKVLYKFQEFIDPRIRLLYKMCRKPNIVEIIEETSDFPFSDDEYDEYNDINYPDYSFYEAQEREDEYLSWLAEDLHDDN